jgi:Ca2+-binding EF-hand superfamily protein
MITLASAALLAGGTAIAQAPERGAVRGADITRDSVEQRATQAFARMDVNGDGKIDAADREARANARFDTVDSDGDGVISREEFTAMREQRQTRRDERRTARAEAGPEAGKRMTRRGPGMMGPRGGLVRSMAMLGQADSDNDGVITQEDFTAAALARFDSADKDGDGTITREERREARPEGRRAHRRAIG